MFFWRFRIQNPQLFSIPDPGVKKRQRIPDPESGPCNTASEGKKILSNFSKLNQYRHIEIYLMRKGLAG
jgi:hypothetical protein